jgi:hypothetical protein
MLFVFSVLEDTPVFLGAQMWNEKYYLTLIQQMNSGSIPVQSGLTTKVIVPG